MASGVGNATSPSTVVITLLLVPGRDDRLLEQVDVQAKAAHREMWNARPGCFQPCSGRVSHAAAPCGFRRELDPRRDVNFAEGMCEVRLHPAPRDKEALPDLWIRQPLGRESNNLDFGGRERVPAGGWPLPGASPLAADAELPHRRERSRAIADGPQLLVPPECFLEEIVRRV
jgi:hypothetical protein